ncbi:MAG: bifunctional oligoribonuclease/PAP phosphatase NrnA [Candidatus Margulisbacteria bacterium]|nr:bifunctional oligoribonuclease/PAP phosphatase NrnA [Candidatus Margulisiibacteriota bacterium]
MKKSFRDIKKLIRSSKTAIIASHVDPDGDTLGSMVAMAMLLEQKGLKVTMFSYDGVPETYHFLPRVDRIISRVPETEFDILVTVDCSDLSRIGDVQIKAKKIINIDHHPDNTRFGDINCIKKVSSVAEQIFELARLFKVKITKSIAIALYVAIITDTGNFRYSDTLTSTFKAAEELLKAGANPWKLSTLVYDTKTIPGMKILAKALQRMKLSKDKKILWSTITARMVTMTGATQEDMVGIIDYLRSVKGPEVAFFMREENEKVKVNFRSKGSVNVSLIAQELGGGGHSQASGCVLDGTVASVQKRVLGVVRSRVK